MIDDMGMGCITLSLSLGVIDPFPCPFPPKLPQSLVVQPRNSRRDLKGRIEVESSPVTIFITYVNVTGDFLLISRKKTSCLPKCQIVTPRRTRSAFLVCWLFGHPHLWWWESVNKNIKHFVRILPRKEILPPAYCRFAVVLASIGKNQGD